MVRIRWTTSAFADLQLVHDYIARDSRKNARGVAGRIASTINRLRRFPYLGEVIANDEEGEVRQLVVGSYRIFYRYDEPGSQVAVVAIIHASRNLDEAMFNRD